MRVKLALKEYKKVEIAARGMKDDIEREKHLSRVRNVAMKLKKVEKDFEENKTFIN